MAKRRINIADILILLIILGLLGAAAYKFGVVNQREAADVEDAAETWTYTAYIDEVRMATVNALHEGDQIFDEKTGVCIGTIQSVSYQPFQKGVMLENGEVGIAEFPDYYSITLTIEGNVIEKEDGYFAEGTVELKANSEMDVYTKYAMPKMQIIEFGR